MVLCELDRLSEKMKNDVFINRVFHLILENNKDFNYGEFIMKSHKNGVGKVLKSLNLYHVKGRGENKKTFVHPMVKLIIDTTISENKTVALSILNLVNGNIKDIEPIIINDFTKYYELDLSNFEVLNQGYSTYIVFDPVSNYFKIGKSKNITNRLESLKKEYNKDLSIIGHVSVDIEKQLHLKHYKKMVFGEWFDITFDEVLDIMNENNFTTYKK